METDEQDCLPRHIAIIMDGNGRWATARDMKRIKGHERGAVIVENIVTACTRIGIPWLTLYAFSLDNWKRPKAEVTFLMHLLEKFLTSKRQLMMNENIRLRAIGRRSLLSSRVRKVLEKIEADTAGHKRMNLNLALSYGSQEEIVDGIRDLYKDCSDGTADIESLEPSVFSGYLQTGGMPDPDILIRTGGETRLSNFLLWQLSYTELFFSDTLWPDFTEEELEDIIQAFSKRERRFGEVLSNG